MTDPDREYLTYAAAATFTSLSVRLLRRAVTAGRLPALRADPTGVSGRPRVLLRRRDLIAFVESFDRVEARTVTDVRSILDRVAAGRGRR